ncbi:pyrophosphate-energized vacuolar membrane proton pump-like protein, partial [Tanacetum coccineum]
MVTSSTTILSDLGTQLIIPVCAIIGIIFSLIQWYLVSKVKLSLDNNKSEGGGENKNVFNESLIEEEEGVNDHNVVKKCAEIQNAISE